MYYYICIYIQAVLERMGAGTALARRPVWVRFISKSTRSDMGSVYHRTTTSQRIVPPLIATTLATGIHTTKRLDR